MDFNFNIPIRVVSGKNAVKNNAHLLSEYGKRCVIVTGGKSAVLSGALADVKAALNENGIEYTVYDKIGPNPRLDHCFECAEAARKFGAEFVMGIGGGSPLDAAKAVAVYCTNADFSLNDIYTVTERKKALPIVLIGTTAGTGSEVGRVSVLTDPVSGRKKSISPSDCYPALTFADSTYTESMPYSVTVSTALDALSHALEGYMSIKCGDIPTLFGEKAVELIWKGLKYLHREKQNPNEKMREELYYGSLYAGITLGYCGTAFPHPMGYILTENYDIPHGKACTVYMDEFIKRSAAFCPQKTERILSVMGTDMNEFITVISELSDIGSIRMTEDEIHSYCLRFESVPNNFKFSPGAFTKEDAIRVLKEKFLS